MSKSDQDSLWGGILPFIGFRDLDQSDCDHFELDKNQKWESFELEWLGICIVVFIRPKKDGSKVRNHGSNRWL